MKVAHYEDVVPALLDMMQEQKIAGGFVDITVKKHECSEYRMKRVDSLANNKDWQSVHGSSQGYQVYECPDCRSIWGCRYQSDPGTGSDHHWKNFGVIDPADVVRHY